MYLTVVQRPFPILALTDLPYDGSAAQLPPSISYTAFFSRVGSIPVRSSSSVIHDLPNSRISQI